MFWTRNSMIKLAPTRYEQSFVSWEAVQHSSHLTTSLGTPVKHLAYNVVFISNHLCQPLEQCASKRVHHTDPIQGQSTSCSLQQSTPCRPSVQGCVGHGRMNIA